MNVAKMMVEKPWRISWPSSLQETVENGALPDVSWKGQIARYRKIFQALSGIEGARCSVVDAQDLFQRMESWSARHVAYFSHPPSEDGWMRAVWATMSEPQGKEDMAWLWAVYGPSVRLALGNPPPVHGWASDLLRVAVEPPSVPAARPPEAKQSPVSPASRSVVEKKDQSAKDREPSPEVSRTREWLIATLDELKQGSEPDGVLREKFDREIKEFSDPSARPGANRMAGWIEYNLLPAVAGLDANQMTRLLDLWPASQSKSFIDPQKTLASKKFWAVVDEPVDQARQIFFERLLPAIINTSEWSASERYSIAVEMLEWTKRRPAVFRERLRLWQAWGGRLDDSVAIPPTDGNMFNKTHAQPETVEDWIRKQGIVEWDAAISAAPRNQRRP